MPRKNRPHTPDGRYLVSRGVLKRCTNPELDDNVRRKALKALMQARMGNDRQSALEAKIILGEAGPVWWEGDTTDYSNNPPANTPYADWWNDLTQEERQAGD